MLPPEEHGTERLPWRRGIPPAREDLQPGLEGPLGELLDTLQRGPEESAP